jgi:hypothetical protein
MRVNNIISKELICFYNTNSSVYTLVVKSFMSEFLISLITNANFAKLILILIILI